MQTTQAETTPQTTSSSGGGFGGFSGGLGAGVDSGNLPSVDGRVVPTAPSLGGIDFTPPPVPQFPDFTVPDVTAPSMPDVNMPSNPLVSSYASVKKDSQNMFAACP